MTESFFRNDAEEEPSGVVPNLSDDGKEGPSGEAGAGAQDAFSTEEGRMAAVLAYIPFLCFVPLLSMKENKEARFHARQGVILFLIEVVSVLFLVDVVSDFVFKAVLVLALALSVAGMYFALQGKSYKLPVVGDLADKTKL